MSMAAPFPSTRTTAPLAQPTPGRPVRHLRVVPVPPPVASTMRRPDRQARPRRLRLTRRGHLVLFAVSSLILLVAVMASGQVAEAAARLVPGPVTATVVVQPGDSLWSIAGAALPGEDPRSVVLRIRELNGLGDWPIVPGQRLVVPAR